MSVSIHVAERLAVAARRATRPHSAVRGLEFGRLESFSPIVLLVTCALRWLAVERRATMALVVSARTL